MVHGVTTEWEDIQVKMGNYTKLDKVPTEEDKFRENIEGLEYYDNRAAMNNEQIEAMAEDDLDFDDEDDFMKQYKE